MVRIILGTVAQAIAWVVYLVPVMVVFFLGSGVAAILTGFANGPLGIALGAYTLVLLVPAGARTPVTR